MALKLAVLASGSGSNLQSILDKIAAGLLDAEVRLVLSNRPGALCLERAKAAGVPTALLDHTAYTSREAFDADMAQAVLKSGADFVALAGFMRMLSPVFLNAFPNRVLNIHPALLPSFKGVHGQADAAGYGVKLAGCTVHYVDEEMDTGPIIAQAAVPVLPGDDGKTLGARILQLEHRIYPQVLQWFSQGRLALDGGKVMLLGSAIPAAPDGPWLVNPPLEAGF